MPAVGVDFDGVAHAYSRGWQGGVIYDPPVPGAFDAIRIMQSHGYAVFIFTARDDLQPVADWITEHSAIDCMIDDFMPGDIRRPKFWNDTERLLVTQRKLPAEYYVDDRAIRFDTWGRTLPLIVPGGEWSAHDRQVVDPLRRL